MKSRIAVSVLSLSVAVLSLALGGCNGNIGNESDLSSGASQSAENSGSSAITDSSDNSENSGSSSAPEPPKPDGEPTIFTAPDGIPIYTSEITKSLDDNGRPISVNDLTLDKNSEIFCDGFQFFKEPLGVTYDTYHDPEMFDDLDFLGEKPINLNPVKRLYVGDEICGLKLTKAITHFTNQGGSVEYNNTITNWSEPIVEFEGTVTLEGFLFITQPNNYEPDGGRLEFIPIEDKLPILGFDQNPGMWAVDGGLYVLSDFGGLALKQEKYSYTDIEGMGLGDLALAKVTISNFSYTNGGGRRATLENVEVTSDVIRHVDAGF